MRLIEFSRVTFCIGVVLCAEVASAQTCQVQQRKQVNVGGYYSYTARGNGIPGSLLGTTGTGGTTPPFTSTEVGQLMAGWATLDLSHHQDYYSWMLQETSSPLRQLKTEFRL